MAPKYSITQEGKLWKLYINGVLRSTHLEKGEAIQAKKNAQFMYRNRTKAYFVSGQY